MFCYVTNIPKENNNFYQNQCYFVSSEIFSLSVNDTKYLMQHKLLLQLNNIIFYYKDCHHIRYFYKCSDDNMSTIPF